MYNVTILGCVLHWMCIRTTSMTKSITNCNSNCNTKNVGCPANIFLNRPRGPVVGHRRC